MVALFLVLQTGCAEIWTPWENLYVDPNSVGHFSSLILFTACLLFETVVADCSVRERWATEMFPYINPYDTLTVSAAIWISYVSFLLQWNISIFLGKRTLVCLADDCKYINFRFSVQMQ